MMKYLDGVPLSMDKFSRNKRLYGHLLSMGFWVSRVTIDGDPEKIDSLIVTAGETRDVNLTPNLPTPDVRFPVDRSEIHEAVGPAI